MASNGCAQVSPERKFLIVETLRQQGFVVGMMGDGVHDAPALKQAGVGIAVHGSTDAARASADVVLTLPGLSTIITAIEVHPLVVFLLFRLLRWKVLPWSW
ncbi:unnamed protein product [Ectocarpus sp. CCAP 1310/34]|nr:unnamed protein product [Ectocarpus sp. CCAP 1310/34]